MMIFNLNGLKLGVQLDDALLKKELLGKFKPFLLRKKDKPEFSLRVRLVNGDWNQNNQDDLIIQQNKHSKIFKVSFRTLNLVINWNAKKAIVETCRQNIVMACLSVENCFRVLTALHLLYSNGFLLHSAAAIYGGKAYLFAGPSGAGKTTVTNILKKKISVLTDDLLAIRKVKDKWHAEPVFFRVLEPKYKYSKYPVAAIFKLVKEKSLKISKLSFRCSLMLLMTQIPFLPDSKKICLNTLKDAELLSKQIPFFSLSFPKRKFPYERLFAHNVFGSAS